MTVSRRDFLKSAGVTSLATAVTTATVAEAQIGPRIVDGQSTTAFNAVLEPAQPKHPDAVTRRQLRSVHVVGQSVQVFFAASGLPIGAFRRRKPC